MLGDEKVGLFKFEQRGIVFVKLFEDFGHDYLPHEFGFVPDLILFTVEVNCLLLPLVKENGRSVGPPEFLVILLIHLAYSILVG